MRTMMRGILSLALVFQASASSCELDSADAVQAGIDSAVFIWAAAKRCKPGSALLQIAPVKCVQDVASAIEAVTQLAAAIAEMVDDCDGIDKDDHECAFEATALVSATAGLTSASAEIADDCAGAGNGFGDVLDTETTLGKCTADAGDSMNSLFEASNQLQDIAKGCDGKTCVADSLDVVNVLTSLGSYIAGAYADCSDYDAEKRHTTADTDAAECTEGILAAIAQLSEVADIGMKMKDACSAQASRLYLARKNEATTSASSSPLVLALAAVLPVTAVLSFVAGKRFSKARRPTVARDAELLESGAEE